MPKRPDRKINSAVPIFSCYMCGSSSCYGECGEKNERSPDLDHNLSKSEIDQGFIKDGQAFDEAGASERRDKYGDVVSHQDHKTYPHNKNLRC